MDMNVMKANAIKAIKAACSTLPLISCVGGESVIKTDAGEYEFTQAIRCGSRNYALVAGVTEATALRHLRKLAKSGHLIERKSRWASRYWFTLPLEEGRAVYNEIVSDLLAKGFKAKGDNNG